VDIVHIDDNMVVVNKPASMPVHPCGRYRHNTVVFLLAKEHQLRDLKTIHRLDRLTSGVLMFGRTVERARELETQIRDRLVEKQYVCRVRGRFPEGKIIECAKSVQVVSHKIGVCKVSPTGKSCKTSFQSVGYNEVADVSVVLCMPKSGRMHQIRVHLQYLGYPIENDPLYNDPVFGPHRGRDGDFGKTDDQLIQDLILIHNAENFVQDDDDQTSEPILMPSAIKISDSKFQQPPVTAVDMCTQTGIDVPDARFDKTKVSVDPHCLECKVRYRDPKPKDLIMYLHAYRYSGPGWSYETPMPKWADVHWKEV